MNRTISTLLSGCVLLAARTAAQTSHASWTSPSADEVNAIYPEVESLYFDLHRTPELAMHEQQTAAKLAYGENVRKFPRCRGDKISLRSWELSYPVLRCFFLGRCLVALCLVS